LITKKNMENLVLHHEPIFAQIRAIYGINPEILRGKWLKLVSKGKSGAKLFRVGECVAKTLSGSEYSVLINVLAPALIGFGSPVELITPPIGLVRRRRTWIMLMPDIFGGDDVDTYDLKGSMRRSELDFLSKFPEGVAPVPAIADACKFLMSIGIIDYSLVIGIKSDKFIAAGIVDIYGIQTHRTCAQKGKPEDWYICMLTCKVCRKIGHFYFKSCATCYCLLMSRPGVCPKLICPTVLNPFFL
jgi:hypothetical protein